MLPHRPHHEPRKRGQDSFSCMKQSPDPCFRFRARRAVTLIELLVAVALTLMVVLAIVRVFDVLGGNVTESRAILELSGELRNASNLLQSDLDRMTAPTLPALDPQSAQGYLEIIEGVCTDWDSDGDRLISANYLRSLNPNDPAFDDLPAAANPSLDPPFDNQYLQNVALILGDTDDVLMGTIRSDGQPFVGRFLGRVIESELAEVVWWVQREQTPLPPGSLPGAVNTSPTVSLTVHRRVLLIRPDLTAGLQFYLTQNPDTDVRALLAENDLSIHPIADVWVANSLAGLTRRENRFAHWGPAYQAADYLLDAFPFPLNRNYLVRSSDHSDVVLGDALAFDIRVYDPSAALLGSIGEAYLVSPTDPGFYHLAQVNPATPQGHGAFVDLGYGYGAGLSPALTSHFSRLPHPKSQLVPQLVPHPDPSPFIQSASAPRVYCTWSTHYECDGINQDAGNRIASFNSLEPRYQPPFPQPEGGVLVDEGTNGLDDPADDTGVVGLVDDLNERETSPPYPVPLRGVEILLRAQEYSTRQVRQTSVVGNFLPE